MIRILLAFALVLFVSSFPVAHADKTLSSEADADRKLKQVLSSYSEFRQVTDHWSFTNRDWSYRWPHSLDPRIEEDLENFVKETIYQGLIMLNSINPILSRKAMPVLEGNYVFVARRMLLLGGHADTRRGLLRNKTRLTRSITETIANLNHPELFDARDNRRGYMEQMIEPEGVKNVIFHEFLHAMGIDTLSRSEHSAAIAEGFMSVFGLIQRSDDVVFACANLIYPSEFEHLYPLASGPPAPVTRQSCTTCYGKADVKCAEFPEGLN